MLDGIDVIPFYTTPYLLLYSPKNKNSVLKLHFLWTVVTGLRSQYNGFDNGGTHPGNTTSKLQVPSVSLERLVKTLPVLL